MEAIILASGSLRRQNYFKVLGLPFTIMPAQIDETNRDNLAPLELARDLATKKVEKVAGILAEQHPLWIFGADTLIAVDGKIFGKPKDRDDAKRMLSVLQGRNHQVISAIALYNGRKKAKEESCIDCRAVESEVNFAPLSDAQIECYLDTGEWQGVAGAYRIQSLGGCLIPSIKGSFSGIVGLPLYEFCAMLEENGYSLKK
jgi:septum formation protein